MYVGVIPARGGSKSIPRKNLAPLGGRPLLAWTADAALQSRRLARTILSTDSPEIAAAGRAMGIEAPFLRPHALAADDTPMLPVLLHALDHLEGQGIAPTALVLLQPTSPLRAARHIDEAIELFEREHGEVVVSVVEVPHRFNPLSVMRLDGRRLKPFLAEGAAVLRRQDKPRLYARNGPAVLVISVRQLRSGTLYGPNTVGYVMDEASSLDIDEPADLVLAEHALRTRESRVVP